MFEVDIYEDARGQSPISDFINDRILLAYWKDNKFILLHHFVKKSKKTPRKEIEKAKRNLNDVLLRGE